MRVAQKPLDFIHLDRQVEMGFSFSAALGKPLSEGLGISVSAALGKSFSEGLGIPLAIYNISAPVCVLSHSTGRHVGSKGIAQTERQSSGTNCL